MDAKEFFKEHPSMIKLEKTVNYLSFSNALDIIHETQIDKQRVKEVIKRTLFGYDNKKMDKILKELKIE